ncbi:MAG: hypothetical protein U0703_08645 [Anaerolineae bacterium]
MLQDYAIGRSRQAICGLLKLYPSEAKVRRGGSVETIKIEAIRVGDIVLIGCGERIPVDGIIREGRSAVDQSPITGESMPVEKNPGDKILAGTLNGQGALDVEVPCSPPAIPCWRASSRWSKRRRTAKRRPSASSIRSSSTTPR